jgi:hypothetical protein
MPTAPANHDAHKYVERIRRHLRGQHTKALQLLPEIPCSTMRSKLAAHIAQSRPKQDINTAWNAVARSPLNTIEKQIMFNELWG